MILPVILKWTGVALFAASCALALYYSLQENRPPVPCTLKHSRHEELPEILPLPPQKTTPTKAVAVFCFALALRLALLAGTLLLRWLIVDKAFVPSLADALNRWDAPHYLWIANNPYQAVTPGSDGHLFIVFFPLYPWLVGFLGGSVTAAVCLNLALSALGSLVLYRWTLEEGQREDTALFAALLWQIFPLSVFQMAPYTESLFVCLTAACLFALRKKRFLAAGILGFFASLTRNVGVLLALPFLIEWARDLKTAGAEKSFRRVFALALIPLGTLVYLGLNDAVYGNPLTFMEIQKSHWYQGFGFFGHTVEYITENFLRAGDPGTRWYLWGSELTTIGLALVTMPFLLKEMSPAERAYSLVYLLFILSPTWLLSFPRYIMGMATLYPALARLTFSRGKARHAAGVVLALAFVAALIWITIGFLSGESVV